VLDRERDPSSLVADVAGGPALVCWECGARVTSPAAQIAVGGAHQHTCTNPHGYRYVIGCFAVAPGCALEGEPSTFWTWFPGHSWQVANCAACRTLLGWRFADGERAFFGLILEQLRLVRD
jgi:hypothetical protein